MKSEELRQWIGKQNLSHSQAAADLSISKRALQAYLYGQNPIPPIVEKMTRYVKYLKDNDQFF